MFEAILQFMNLTLRQLHPHYHEYPFVEMAACRDEFGDDSEEFETQYAPYLQQAFFMKEAIDKLEKLMQG